MKTVLSVLCCLCIVVLFTGCDNGDDGGSSGGPGRWPAVNWEIQTNSNGDATVVCYNADSNYSTTRKTCIWNCAFYHIDKPRYVQLWFDDTLDCETTATSSTTSTTGQPDTTTGTTTENCTTKVGLVRESFKSCRLDNPPPY